MIGSIEDEYPTQVRDLQHFVVPRYDPLAHSGAPGKIGRRRPMIILLRRRQMDNRNIMTINLATVVVCGVAMRLVHRQQRHGEEEDFGHLWL